MEKWVHAIRFTVPYSDIDMMGHVNNAKYLTYFETVRSEYFYNTGRYVTNKGLGLIIAKVEIEYKSQAKWHDLLAVRMRPLSVGNSSWVYEYEVVNEKENNRVVATGKSIQVAFDYSKQTPIPIPGDARETLLSEIEETRDL